MRRLVVLQGRAEPAEIDAERDLLVGRAREADLRLYDETASRRHARVRESEGRVWLEDLGSANGVLLNGERVQGRAALFHGDEIRIGGVRLRFVTSAGADRDTVASPAEGESIVAAVDPDEADPAADAGDEASVRRLRLVCDGAAACAEAAAPDEVLAALLRLVVATYEPDRATISLVVPGGGTKVVAAHPEGAEAPRSRTLTARVLEAGEAVWLRDAHERRDEGPRGASIVASRYRSALAAPLRTGEGVVGFVAVETEGPSRFDRGDLRALAAVARQAALALRNLRALSSARAECSRLAGATSPRAGTLLGDAPSIQEVRNLVERAASVDSPVLVTGETGTGKELVARALHAQGERRDAPFVALNCAAIPEGLLESELFGHEKGAFTGAHRDRAGLVAAAGRGTLFLDEVGDLPAPLQAKLLRLLSEGTYTRVGGSKPERMGCRVVAATHRDLRARARDGTFREDLYFRLAVLEIHLPPLRERSDDVLRLAEAGLERIAARLGRRVPRLAEDARERLAEAPWPGNVRELFNVLERALVLLEGDTLTASDLPDLNRAPEADAGSTEVVTIREAERRAVKAALEATGGRKGKAAELLGISWPTLNRKIREYGL